MAKDDDKLESDFAIVDRLKSNSIFINPENH